MSATGSHHVLLLPGESLDPVAVSRRLAPLLGVQHPLDLAQTLRYGGGWVVRHVTEEIADEVVASIGDEDADDASVRIIDGALSAAEPRAVKRITFDGGVLTGDLPGGRRLVAVEEIGCVHLTALGDPEPGETAGESGAAGEVLGRHAALLTGNRGFPFSAQRGALLEGELQPLLFIFPRRGAGGDESDAEPEIWRIERGTLFPHYAGIIGGVWLDNLLTFVQHLLSIVDGAVVTAGTASFWESADIGDILIHKEEELANRVAWLAELVDRDLLKRP